MPRSRAFADVRARRTDSESPWLDSCPRCWPSWPLRCSSPAAQAQTTRQADPLHRAQPARRRHRFADAPSGQQLGETLKLARWSSTTGPAPAATSALDFVAKAAPDGYTLVMGEIGNLAINPSLYKKLPFDPAKDVAPIALVGHGAAGAGGHGQRALRFAEGAGRRREDEAAHRSLPPATARSATWSARRGSAPWQSTWCMCLQGRRAGDDRPAGRPGRPELRLPAGGVAADRKRQAARAGDDHGQAPAVACRMCRR